MHALSGAALAVSDEAGHAAGHASGPVAQTFAAGPMFGLLVVALPLLACILCGLCAMGRVKTKLPAFLTVLCLAGSFLVTLALYLQHHGQPAGTAWIIQGFEWIRLDYRQMVDSVVQSRSFIANFGLYVDSLTCLWMLFVTGLATLIALYASEYMSHDVGQGYNRFFAAFSLFVFSMACLVMADNLVLLYLGWEGVGLCSYLLIGYFYKKPSAVAAAKKAFILNRIGDLGLALGIMLCYVHFGSVEYKVIFEKCAPYMASLAAGQLDQIPLIAQFIPLCLMIGAFGKSAQLPLYVWLPDAMEGPTPVSALIHAATMVTAGVFLIARTYPLFLMSEYALPIVAWVGALTALLAATIGMAQFDIKRIMAYSTVSQLGYMFAGLAVLTSVGGAAHVFTHAFFKAMLFLACGAVMHGFAGQLDLRKLSGVGSMPGWRVVGIAMLVGCLNLAGFPIITAGFWSKDMILGEAFANSQMQAIGWILLLTAGLTAYYTFRVYFRVFVGPKHYEPGDEHHGDDHGHDHGHGHADGHDEGHQTSGKHGFHPHAPGWAINTVLATLAVAAFVIVPLVALNHGGWVKDMVGASSAQFNEKAAYLIAAKGDLHTKFFGFDAHKAMMVVSSIVGLIGIAVAFVLHYQGRTTAATSKADALLPAFGPIAKWAQNKWYVDEFYNAIVRMPLLALAQIFHWFDKLVIDGLVDFFGWTPRGLGGSLRPAQSGEMHTYAVGMAGGLAVMAVVVIVVLM
ncbi:MAG: NADH-quinone oxidoreductase subunit L [Planctomycetes bacterium]|nr:NADH-quinone oxidoreductase subunit L [Planctomycetota bacterium]